MTDEEDEPGATTQPGLCNPDELRERVRTRKAWWLRKVFTYRDLWMVQRMQLTPTQLEGSQHE